MSPSGKPNHALPDGDIMLLSFIMDVARNVYSEPKGGFSKPLVLEELKKRLTAIFELKIQDLLSWLGQEIAMDIAGLLAFHSSEDVEGEEWLTPTTEPVLDEILQIAARLELNPDDPKSWQKMRKMLRYALADQGDNGN